MADVFVVTMYRYGDREKHSYVSGVYDSYEIALVHGSAEEAWRGGKYVSEILKVEVNKEYVDDCPETIKALPYQ